MGRYSVADLDVDDFLTLEQNLETAKKILGVIERQIAGYTSLTVPPHLLVEFEDKRREVASYETRIEALKTQKEQFPSTATADSLSTADCIEGKRILSDEGIQLLVRLLNASHLTVSPRQRRELVLKIGFAPEEFLFTGPASDEFAAFLVYRLSKTGKPQTIDLLIDEIAQYLPPSLAEQIAYVRNDLYTSVNSDEPIVYDVETLSPLLEEIQVFIDTLASKTIRQHLQFLYRVGIYFQRTEPSELSEDYIKITEKLLNKIDSRAYESKWPVPFQEITLEALSLSGVLAKIVKKHPNQDRTPDFNRNARKLGQTLVQLRWRNMQ